MAKRRKSSRKGGKRSMTERVSRLLKKSDELRERAMLSDDASKRKRWSRLSYAYKSAAMRAHSKHNG